MPLVGIEKLYVAVNTKDDLLGLTYAVPKYYAGVQEIDIKPKQNTEKQYAENQLWDQVTTFDSCDVTVKLSDLTSAQRAELLGQTIASVGGVYAKSTDSPPFVAILYKATIRGGYRYGALYKGVFQIPDEDAKGQEGKVTFGSPSVAGTFQATKYNGLWEYHVETTDPNCPADIDSTWFNGVTIPTADTTPPTVTTTPADAASAVPDNTNMVWTFSESIDPAKVTADNFFLMKATDGTLVANTLSLDGTGKVVTLAPTASLAAATAYIAICTTNVTDLAGNKLVAISVTNFTTV